MWELGGLTPDGESRVMLGLGAWWEPIAGRVGADRRKPLTAMRENIEAIRALFTMEEVTYEGEFVHLDRVRLDVAYGDTSPRDIPIYIGATGPKMLELTGEICDGPSSTTSCRPTTSATPSSGWRRGRNGRARPSTRSIDPSCSCARCPTTTRRGDHDRQVARRLLPRNRAPHHEGVRGRPGAGRSGQGEWSAGPPPRPTTARRPTSSPTSCCTG